MMLENCNVCLTPTVRDLKLVEVGWTVPVYVSVLAMHTFLCIVASITTSYFAPLRLQNIVMCMSVHTHNLNTAWLNFTKFFCAGCLWPWLGPLLVSL